MRCALCVDGFGDSGPVWAGSDSGSDDGGGFTGKVELFSTARRREEGALGFRNPKAPTKGR